eukprot:1138344-Pelagomonas_calceolata.AAC.5
MDWGGATKGRQVGLRVWLDIGCAEVQGGFGGSPSPGLLKVRGLGGRPRGAAGGVEGHNRHWRCRSLKENLSTDLYWTGVSII